MGAGSLRGVAARALLCLLVGEAYFLEETASPPGPLFSIDQCNTSRARGVPVPEPCVRPDCVAGVGVHGEWLAHRRMLHPRSEVMFFVREWESMQGFLGFESAFFMHLVSTLQNNAGVSGGIGEIGLAAGKSFITMALTRRLGEPLFACDIFGGGEEKHNAADVLGGQRRAIFAENLLWANVSVSDVTVHDGSSAELSDVDLMRATGGAGFRLFHVDGGHLAKYAYHDIAIAACALVEGGVIMVDDVFSSKWMGAAEGFHRFMHTQRQILRTISGDLVPFLYVGRIYLTHRRFAEAYRKALHQTMEGTLVTKEMYGSEVLLFKSYEVFPSAFDSYLKQEEEFFGL